VHTGAALGPTEITPRKETITVETNRTSIPDQTDNTERAPALKVGDRVQHDDGRYGTVREFLVGMVGDRQSVFRGAVLVRWDEGVTEWVDEALLTGAVPEAATAAASFELLLRWYDLEQGEDTWSKLADGILTVDAARTYADEQFAETLLGGNGGSLDWRASGDELAGYLPGSYNHPLYLVRRARMAAADPADVVDDGRPGDPPCPPMAWRVAADLRQLAELLDQHPELGFASKYGTVNADFSLSLVTPEQVEQWAAALGLKTKQGRSGSMPILETESERTDAHPLGIWVYAELPKPDPAEVEKALAFYRKYGPADRAVARCAGCRAMITSTRSQPWMDEAGSSQCASSGVGHQPEGHGPRAGEQA
jgi:hypothetical protein